MGVFGGDFAFLGEPGRHSEWRLVTTGSGREEERSRVCLDDGSQFLVEPGQRPPLSTNQPDFLCNESLEDREVKNGYKSWRPDVVKKGQDTMMVVR